MPDVPVVVAAAEGDVAEAEPAATAPEDVEPVVPVVPVVPALVPEVPVDEVEVVVCGEPFTASEVAAVVLKASNVLAAVGLTAKTMPA